MLALMPVRSVERYVSTEYPSSIQQSESGGVAMPSHFTPGTEILRRAMNCAITEHNACFFSTLSGHKRPQIAHLREVAELVRAHGGSDREVAAAWLHDVLEDTNTAKLAIRQTFGDDIAEVVLSLTDDEEIMNLPLLRRKQIQAERIRYGSTSAKLIKLADQTSNVRAMACDPIRDMQTTECKTYITGARLVAWECRNASPKLYSLFLDAYRFGMARFR
jgi:(p)ppGpp synthase/HD superfamily hydrolase